MGRPSALRSDLRQPPEGTKLLFLACGVLGYSIANILTTILSEGTEAYGLKGRSAVLQFHLGLIFGSFIIFHCSPVRYHWRANRPRVGTDWDIPLSVFASMGFGLVVGLGLGHLILGLGVFTLPICFWILDGSLLLLIALFTIALGTDTEMPSAPVEQGYISPSGTGLEELEQTAEKVENELPPNESGRTLILQRRANGNQLLRRDAVIRRSMGNVLIIDLTLIFVSSIAPIPRLRFRILRSLLRSSPVLLTQWTLRFSSLLQSTTS